MLFAFGCRTVADLKVPFGASPLFFSILLHQVFEDPEVAFEDLLCQGNFLQHYCQ
jgi:hypothetical protein